MNLADEAARIAARNKSTSSVCVGYYGDEPCTAPAVRDGLCDVHLRRRARGNKMDAPRLRRYMPTDRCAGKFGNRQCKSKPFAAGLCSLHYQRQYHGRDPAARKYAHRKK